MKTTFSILAFITLAGCGVAPASVNLDSSNADHSVGARLGQHCGGNIATAAKKCAPGLICQTVTDEQGHPIFDAGGICVAEKAEEGEHCGGNIFGAKSCSDGLTCQTVTDEQGHPIFDAGGTCVAE